MKSLNYVMLALFSLIVPVQRIHAETSFGLVGDLIERLMQDPSEGRLSFEGKLSATAHQVDRYMNAYVQWHDTNKNLADAALIAGMLVLKGGIGAAAASPKGPLAAIIGGAVGVGYGVVDELTGTAAHELAGDQIAAVVHFGATQFAPVLMKADSTLTESEAILLGSTAAAATLTSTQFKGFITGIRGIGSAQYLKGFTKITPAQAVLKPINNGIQNDVTSNLFAQGQQQAGNSLPQLNTIKNPFPDTLYAEIQKHGADFFKPLESATFVQPLRPDGNAVPNVPFFQNIPTAQSSAENWHLPENVAPLMNPLAHMADHEPFRWSDLADAFTIKPGDVAAQDKAFLQAYDASPELPPTARLSTLFAERRLETLNPMPNELPASFRMSEVLQHRMDYLKPMPLNNELHNNFVQPMFEQNFQQQFPAAYMPVQQLPFGQQQFNIQPMQQNQFKADNYFNPGAYQAWQGQQNNFGGNWLRH